MGFLNISKWATIRNLVCVLVGCAALAVLGVFFYGAGFFMGAGAVTVLTGHTLLGVIAARILSGFLVTCLSIAAFSVFRVIGYMILHYFFGFHDPDYDDVVDDDSFRSV